MIEALRYEENKTKNILYTIDFICFDLGSKYILSEYVPGLMLSTNNTVLTLKELIDIARYANFPEP